MHDNYPSNKLERKLVEWGFSKGNPFATIEAEHERDYPWDNLFIPIAEFERVRNDETLLIFAPRGGGKSTMRIRVAMSSLPVSAKADTLAVEFVDFLPLVEKYQQEGRLTEKDCTKAMLSHAVEAFWRTLFPQTAAEDTRARNRRITFAANLGFEHRTYLSAMILNFAPRLLTPASLYSATSQYVEKLSVDWPTFRDAVRDNKLGLVIPKEILSSHPVVELLVHICDEIPFLEDYVFTDFAWYELLRDILHEAGIRRLHFLVDSVDELRMTANNIELQADILEPILSYHLLLGIQSIGFKFFLMRGLQDELISRSVVIRQDKLQISSVSVTWTEEQLLQMLAARMRYFSNGEISDFSQLVADNDPEVAKIEAEMAKMAQGSPRRLLQISSLLCKAHVDSGVKEGFISHSDWLVARARAMTIMPPTLLIDLVGRSVYSAIGEATLSKRELQVLSAIIHNGDECSKMHLRQEVWAGVVEDDTIDQTVGRIRKKIGDENQTYLRTIRGRGYSLHYYEKV